MSITVRVTVCFTQTRDVRYQKFDFWKFSTLSAHKIRIGLLAHCRQPVWLYCYRPSGSFYYRLAQMYKRYGQPNDLLILSTYNFSVRDITIRPVYDVGEVSGIKINKVILPILGILFRGGLKRIGLKYILLIPSTCSFLDACCVYGFAVADVLYSCFSVFTVGLQTPLISLISFLFTLSFALNSFFFATWMDMEANKNLR